LSLGVSCPIVCLLSPWQYLGCCAHTPEAKLQARARRPRSWPNHVLPVLVPPVGALFPRGKGNTSRFASYVLLRGILATIRHSRKTNIDAVPCPISLGNFLI